MGDLRSHWVGSIWPQKMGVIWVKMEIFEPEATGRNSVARKRKELPQIGWCQNDRNFGGFAAVNSDFYVFTFFLRFLTFFYVFFYVFYVFLRFLRFLCSLNVMLTFFTFFTFFLRFFTFFNAFLRFLRFFTFFNVFFRHPVALPVMYGMVSYDILWLHCMVLHAFTMLASARGLCLARRLYSS